MVLVVTLISLICNVVLSTGLVIVANEGFLMMFDSSFSDEHILLLLKVCSLVQSVELKN